MLYEPTVAFLPYFSICSVQFDSFEHNKIE